MLCAILIESVILVASCFWHSTRYARLPIMAFAGTIWYIKSFYPEEYADQTALYILSKITLVDYSWFVSLYESCSAVSDIVFYYILYFFAVYAAYYAVVIIIFLPLASAVILLSFGYLIGYVIAGRLSTAFIFIAATASYYLLAVFPFCREVLMAKFGRGHGLFVMQMTPEGKVAFFPTQAIERELIRPLEDPTFVAISGCKDFNLHLNFGNFIETPFFTACFEFVVDSVSLVMVVTVTTISSLVHLYSTVYMSKDPHQVRFFALLSLFTFFMILLVTAGNLLLLYVG